MLLTVSKVAGAAALGLLGGYLALVNSYLTFLRVPLHRRRFGAPPERNVSTVPLVGSALLWLAAALLWEIANPVAVGAIAFSALDTGGPHWIFAILVVGRAMGTV